MRSASYTTIKRRLPLFATKQFRDNIIGALTRYTQIGSRVLVFYDVTTLYFETDTPDKLGKPGYSKERCSETPITVGLLTKQPGRAPSDRGIRKPSGNSHDNPDDPASSWVPYKLDDITVVTDAGMFSAGNKSHCRCWPVVHPGSQISKIVLPRFGRGVPVP